ncbi:hypothetical protein [Brevundimonas sp.]|uniref:hypothetical protein n=1 Tax=Brevundimonas sp. TaxID=1871086 RepID=UPI0025C608A0|nr:hypothetical protein [Brevundimonas sp.]
MTITSAVRTGLENGRTISPDVPGESPRSLATLIDFLVPDTPLPDTTTILAGKIIPAG